MSRINPTAIAFAALLAASPAMAQSTTPGGGAPDTATSGGATPAGRNAAAPGTAATVGSTTPNAAPNAAPGLGTTGTGMGGNGATASASASHNAVLAENGAVRASMVVGASVYNDKAEKLGSVNDILLDKDHKATEAVISVGGILGVGAKLVTVPYAKLSFPDKVDANNSRVMLPGMTSDALNGMPTFHYAAQ